jgi:ABC-type transport system involved in multi-copper enzyme maturation permease subunit
VIAAIRSELVLLNRRRLWWVLSALTVLFVVPATWLIISTAEPASRQGQDGISLEAITGAGGATQAVVSSIAFSSVLVLAAFISSTANEFTRGTLRVAFTRTSRRLGLLAGKVTARMGVATVVMVAALAIGWLTAMLVAPGSDVSTDGWWGGSAFAQAGEDLLRLIGFVFVYAVIGTTIAVLVKSTPVALGIGLAWFGPIENVIGEGQSWANRWFPGLLLRSVLRPDMPGGTATGTALVTLALYLAIAVGVTAVVITRRDITS